MYSASGDKLRKIVTDNTVSPAKITTTDYISGIVYQNDTLQFIPHDEGRVRLVLKTGQAPQYVFDYFLKDHLGNIREVLTTTSDTAIYAATLETGNSAVENALFSNIDNTRTALPTGYPADGTTNPNAYAAKLNAQSGQKTGPSIVLRVMAGDVITIGTRAYYTNTGANTRYASTADMITSLLQAFATGGQADGAHVPTGSSSPMSSTIMNSSVFDQIKQTPGSEDNASKPKAYLNFVLFDDQFNMVSSNSGNRQVQASPGALQTLAVSAMTIKSTGFIYIYVSNESGQDVYFDNLVVNHTSGPLLEETHYYPFGLTMAGISNHALGKLENRFKYNGKELQNEEFSYGSGLEVYDYGARFYDNQIGRFFTQDRFADKYFALSPYLYTADNPIRYVDANGDSIIDNNQIVANLKSFLNTSITTINGLIKEGTLPQGISEDDAKALVGEYQTTLGEIGTLEKSDQIYNVAYNTSRDEGGTSYNNENGQIDVGVAKGTNPLQSAGLAAHELKHAYQYETGLVSFSVDGRTLGKLYDVSDEKAAYNRQAYLENGVFFRSHLLDNNGVIARGVTMTPPAYQGLPSGPIDINSKAGKALRQQTINARKAGTPVPEVYKGYQTDYKKGQQQQ
ncbi:hypothetical protein DCM91_20895 [Chitinophaga costaii]|nr:hypothetical protein DCM91_20895 [Chitinophaga costaii]